MKHREKRDLVVSTIKLERSTYERLKEWAAKESRSINNSVEMILRKVLNEPRNEVEHENYGKLLQSWDNDLSEKHEIEEAKAKALAFFEGKQSSKELPKEGIITEQAIVMELEKDSEIPPNPLAIKD